MDLRTIYTFILMNALTGILLFEWAWSKTDRVRIVDEKRDNLFPAWRREDTPKWSRLRFYPGAVSILPLRFFCMILLAIILYLVTRLIFIGVDITKKVPDSRRRIQQAWYAFVAFSCLNIFFIVTVDRKANKNFDYSHYLGPDYLKDLKEGEKAATIVPNHISGFDIFQVYTHTRGKVSFLASDHLEKVPVVGYCVVAGDGLFARRGASLKVRQACVD